MSIIVEYIMNNYIWILSIIIVILLAVIGYFADKTNFGQGKQLFDFEEEPKEETQKIELENLKLNDLLESNIEQEEQQQIGESTELIVPDSKKEEDKKIEDFDTSFDKIIKDKPILDDSLLADIDNLTFEDKKSKKEKKLPRIEDIELPKIESLSEIDDEIWRF